MKSISNASVKRFQMRLESGREQALRSLVRLGSEARDLDVDSPMDIGDQSVGHLVRESLYLQGSRCRRLLRRIDAALERIREGTYGTCDRCGDEISARRLEALPWTDCCLRCQERMEQRQQAEASSDDMHVAWGRTA